MKSRTVKSLKFIFFMIVIIALVSPMPVLAQDEGPTPEPTTAIEVVTDVPTEVATEEPTELATEEPLADPTVEPTVVPTDVVTEPLVVEPILEIVETAADAEVQLVDDEGNPVVMGSAASAELLSSNPDPWIIRGAITYRFLADCTPYLPNTATEICQQTSTPIQDAINFANSGETVNLSGTFSNETINISKSITLDGGGVTTIFAPSNTISGTSDLSTGGENYYGLIFINKATSGNITVNLQNLILDGSNITNSTYTSSNNAVGVLIGNNAIVNIFDTSIINFAQTGGSNPNGGIGVAQFSNNSQTLTMNHDTISDNNIGYLANSNSLVSGSYNNFLGNTYWSLDFYHGRLTNSYWGIDPTSTTYFGTARTDTNKRYFWYDFDGDSTNDPGEQVYYLFLDCPNNQYETISGTPCTFNGTTFASIPSFFTGTYTSKYSKNNFDRFADAADLGDIEPYEIVPLLSELHCPDGTEPNEAGDECVPVAKFDICHSDSGYPTYTLNNVSVNSVLDTTTCTLKTGGHGADPYDIIPPYTCAPGVTFAGQGDQVILENRCEVKSISINKSVAEEDFDSTSDTLHYTYVITNTGGVTLNGQFTVTDDKINGGAAFNCGASGTSLDPGGTVTCTASYPITQADLDAGSVTNTANGHIGTVNSSSKSVTVNAIQNQVFTVDKTIESAGPFVSGSTILYSILITNTGNVTLSDVTVSDPNAILGTCTPILPVSSLAPGGTITCSASHVVLPVDITAGLSYSNTAYVTSGKVTISDTATVTLDILGCMDPVALNYNPSATLSDGSCTYTIPLVPVTGGGPAPLLIPVTGVGGLIPVTGGTLISAGLGHTCMTYADGKVVCWGLNDSGQLGDGTNINRLSPVIVEGVPAVLNLTTGSKHTCVLTVDGEIWCWGENSSGQLGNGKTVNSSVPVKVNGLPDKVVAITAGENFTCAALVNQEVWCWGENDKGQLNDGGNLNQSKPVKTKLTSMFAQISGGQELLLGGDVLGSVNNWANVVSTPINEVANALSISANRWGLSGCAVTFEGTVKCWGDNLVSTAVANAPKALEVGAGLDHDCAINEDASVSCWGSNGSGQLGNGTLVDSDSATLVKNLSLVHALAVGAHNTCILTGSANTAMCWGENEFGQLGNNSTTDSNLPVYVVMPQ